MQPMHQEGPVVHLLAAAVVERTTHTTSPDSSGSRRKWRMGQLHHRLGHLLQVREAVLEEQPGHRAAGAVAAVSSCYPDHRGHVAYYCSFPSAYDQYEFCVAEKFILPLDQPCPRSLVWHHRWLDEIQQDRSHARYQHRRLGRR